MKILCLGAIFLSWPLIPFGAYVRLKNAGLSCPDWPLCFGQLIPPPGYEIGLEVGHRLMAVFLGLLIILIALLSFREKKYTIYRKLAVINLTLVIFQGILGGLTVTMKLWPPMVVFHLLGGNILFGLIVYFSRIVFNNIGNIFTSRVNGSEKFLKIKTDMIKRNLIIMIAILFIIIFSGGYNSGTYSGSHCEAFPGCHEGSFFSFGLSGTDISFLTGFDEQILQPAPVEFQGKFLPEYKNEWIHMIHRLIAMIGGAALMFLSWLWLKNRLGYHLIGNSLIILVLIEIFLGILNAIFRVQAIISVMHTTVAATLTGLLFLAIAEVDLEKRRGHDNCKF